MSFKDIDNGRPRIVCTRMKESGTCKNRRGYYIDEIEKRVVAGLQEKLSTQAAVAKYVKTFNAEMQRASAGKIAARSRMEGRVAAAQRELDRTVAALVRGLTSEAEAEAHLPGLRAECDRLTAELATIDKPPMIVTLHPAAVDAYLRDLQRLDKLINSDLAEGDDGLARVIRNLISTVAVMPAPTGTSPAVEVKGHLAALLESAGGPPGTTAGSVVAEVRYTRSPPSENEPLFGFTRVA